MNLNDPNTITAAAPTSMANNKPSPPGRKPPEASTITRGTNTVA